MTEYVLFGSLLSKVIDNRGRTCPTASTGTPLIATNCVTNNSLYPTYDKVRYVDDETMRTWFRGHPLPGDLLFVLKGTPGRVALVPDPVDFCIAQDMVALRADPKKVYPKYLFAVLRSDSIQQEIEGLHVGTLIPHFKKGDFDELKIPVVERSLQKYIGDQYLDFSLKIDLLTRQNITLEALAQTFFRQWFLANNENDPIPVSDIATLENNSVNPGRQPLEPFYHYSIPAFDNAQTPVVELGKAILSNKFNVLPNTILVSKLNPVTPRIWRIGENVQPNSVCSTEFQVLKPNDVKHYLFLYCLMRSNDVVASFAMSATGTSGSHQRIRPEYILEVETPAPDDEKLALFNEVCTPMMERIKKNQKQILTLQKLRDTLLPKLISGEVRIKQ